MHVHLKVINPLAEIVIDNIMNTQIVLRTNSKIEGIKVIISSSIIIIITVEVDSNMNVSSVTLDHPHMAKIVTIKTKNTKL